MEIQALKIFNSIKLILFLILVLGVITVLTACGDLVKESEKGACDSAMDARDYETAKSVCTDRKNIASAYMGLAGFDIINFLKSAKTKPPKYTKPTALVTDDVAGAFILNILQLGVNEIDNDTKRATKIAESKTYLDNASSILQPYLTDNSSPLDTDEILLNTFAISFAMQLYQIKMFDNETTSKTKFPTRPSNAQLCAPVDNVADNTSVLIPSDGHIWTAERDGMMCARIKNAVDDNASGAATIVNWWESNKELHSSIYKTVCAN